MATSTQITKTSRQPTLLAVVAHPDDESFLMGGTLSLYSQLGFKVKLLCLTSGEMGEDAITQKSHPTRLANTRLVELNKACKVLGVELLPLPNLPDGKLAQLAPGLLETTIGQAIYSWQPDFVLTFGWDGLTGHPDHLATCAATTLVFQQAAGPGTMLFYSSLSKKIVENLSHKMEGNLGELALGLVGLAESEFHVCIDIRQTAHYKWVALECHRSQSGSFDRLTQHDRKLLGQSEYFKLAMVAGKTLTIPDAPYLVGDFQALFETTWVAA